MRSVQSMRLLRNPLGWAIAALAAAVLLTAVARARVPEPPAHRATHVLIVSVDGLRPDVLLRADAPAVRSLLARGAFTLWARTVPAAITLPSHTSMLTGVLPSHHGVEWNSDLPVGEARWPRVPTLFELAHRAGLTTAMAAGKSKFVALAKPGTIDELCVPPRGKTYADSVVADSALRWLGDSRPNVLFVHLPGVDLTGHDVGWGTPQQLVAVAIADRCIGRLLARYEAIGLLDSTLVIVTADHGGAAKTHGQPEPRSRTIPWICAGPGVRRGYDLSSGAAPGVNTEDTFATACWVLGLTPTVTLDGQPVLAAFEP